MLHISSKELDVDPNNSHAVSHPKDKPAVLVTRVILLLVGLTIAHLGVTLFLESDLGSDPFNVLVQGLYRSLS